MIERGFPLFHCHHGKGDHAYAEADRPNVKAIKTLERMLESEHPDLATMLNNRAVLFKSLVNTERGWGT